MTITFPSGIITVNNHATHTFADIYAADVAGAWGVVTKLGDNLYKTTANIRWQGTSNLVDTNHTVEWENASPYFQDTATCTLGELASSGRTYRGITWIFTGSNSSPSFIDNWVFRGSVICSFYGSRFVWLKGSRRFDFSTLKINSTTAALARVNYINCEFTKSNGTNVSVLHFYQSPLSTISGIRINQQAGNLYFEPIAAGLTFTDIVTNGDIVAGSESTGDVTLIRPTIRDVAPTVTPRNAKFFLISPVFDAAYSEIGLSAEGGYNSNTQVTQQYYYSLTIANGITNAALNGAVLRVYDVSSTQVFSISSNSSGVFAQQTINTFTYAGTSMTKTTFRPHEFNVGFYGFFKIQYDLDNPKSLSFSEARLLLPAPTVLSQAAAAALTGIAVNHSTDTLTLSTSRTGSNIFDYGQYDLLQGTNIREPEWFTSSDGVNFTCLYNLVLSSSANITSGSVTLGPSKTLTISVAGTYSSDITIPSTGIVVVASGATDIRTWTIASGATINVSSGTATVTVAETSGLIAGSGVTLVEPVATTTFTGFPTANNSNGVAPAPVIGFYSSASSAGFIAGLDTSDPEYSVGSFEVLLSDYPGVTHIVGDAIGWIRTDYIPVDAGDPPSAVSLAAAFREIVSETGVALVGNGTTLLKDKLTYDQANTRFEVAAGPIDFESTLDKKEELTSNVAGLEDFETAIVRQIQFISSKYGNEILLPDPLTIAAAEDAATSPILENFLVVRAGAPTEDPFEHGLSSTAVGLTDRPEIRMISTLFIGANSGTEINLALTEIRDYTRPMAKQLGLIEGITATHSPTGVVVSDGDGSTVTTDNGGGSYTVEKV